MSRSVLISRNRARALQRIPKPPREVMFRKHAAYLGRLPERNGLSFSEEGIYMLQMFSDYIVFQASPSACFALLPARAS